MISMDKQYRTKSGLEVRIYATDVGGDFPIHGAVLIDGKWKFRAWRYTGSWGAESEYDLIEVKPRIQREYWVNVKHNDYSSLHYTRKAADTYPDDRIACVKIIIDCEEGEGL